MLIGDNAFGFDGYGRAVVLKIQGCPALSIQRSEDGVLLSAEVNDGAGVPPVEIVNNGIVAENGETYSAKQSDDFSKFSLKKVKTGRILLEAEFLNKTTIRVHGDFGCLRGKAVSVRDDQPIPGFFMSLFLQHELRHRLFN